MAKEKEIWKTIPYGDDAYEASNLGRIRSWKRAEPIILKPSKHFKGYLKVVLSYEGKNRMFLIHQLVAMAFLGHVPNRHSLVIDHINNDKTDNRPENLRIVSDRINCLLGLNNKGKGKCPGIDISLGRWRARIKIDNKTEFLGRFNTKEEAIEARNKRLKEYEESGGDANRYKRIKV